MTDFTSSGGIITGPKDGGVGDGDGSVAVVVVVGFSVGEFIVGDDGEEIVGSVEAASAFTNAAVRSVGDVIVGDVRVDVDVVVDDVDVGRLSIGSFFIMGANNKMVNVCTQQQPQQQTTTAAP